MEGKSLGIRKEEICATRLFPLDWEGPVGLTYISPAGRLGRSGGNILNILPWSDTAGLAADHRVS